MNEKLLTVIVGAVVLVFLGNFVLTVVDKGYSPDPTIGPIMGTVAGGAIAWATYQISRKKDSD